MWVRRIQYDGEGWGEGKPYVENRDGAKCLHSTLRYITMGSEIAPASFPSFNGVAREQSAEYF